MSATLNSIAEKWFAWELSMFWQVGVLITIIFYHRPLNQKMALAASEICLVALNPG